MAEAWAPTTGEVAEKIPTRTRSRAAPGSTQLLGQFTEDTEPTAEQAQGFVDNAVAWVLAATGQLPTVGQLAGEIEAAARDAAAWRAAADIEMAYPERTANINVASTLDSRANAALAQVLAALRNEQGGGPELYPQWAAPDPVTWGDELLL